ncbi:MAG: deiodinase [Candidatus Solibacter usitatus]|nr:deiodinase [Candidatus Solibacter usitatus]
MYQKYRGKVEFLLVYIREAHATDGWQLPVNERQEVLLPIAKSQDEKEDHATACVRKLNIEFPAVVDNMDNTTELNYSAWPDRLYLVGKDGRITYKSGPGPQGFKPPELEAAIRKELAGK